jgi:hypothetical protein
MPHRIREEEVNRQKSRLLALLLFLLGTGGVPLCAQEESIIFEDDQQILTRLSENLSMDQISLRSFQCRERLVVTESDVKRQTVARREFLNRYQVERQQNREVATRATFQETRMWGKSSDGKEPGALGDLPTLDTPFTGAINQMFDFENRFASDFHKERQEVIDGNNCEVLRFETVPQLAGQQINILGRPVPLRQRGLVWIGVNDNRLLRISAKQLKLPKGWRNYEFQIDYRSETLFGKRLYLPGHTLLKIELKDKRYVVEQEYFDFEARR